MRPRACGGGGRRVLLQILRDPRFMRSRSSCHARSSCCSSWCSTLGPRSTGSASTPARMPTGRRLHRPLRGLRARRHRLVRERTGGTLDRMLVREVPASGDRLGYVAGFAGLACAQSALVVTTIALLYDVPRLGARPPGSAGRRVPARDRLDRLGLIVSSTARSEGQIFPFIPAVIVPSLLLSGLMIPFARAVPAAPDPRPSGAAHLRGGRARADLPRRAARGRAARLPGAAGRLRRGAARRRQPDP